MFPKNKTIHNNGYIVDTHAQIYTEIRCFEYLTNFTTNNNIILKITVSPNAIIFYSPYSTIQLKRAYI